MSAPPPPLRPFRVHEPAVPGPVVVEVPHAGLAVDERAARFTRVPERALVADADVAADALFGDVAEEGAALVVATASRFVIDLNTAPRVPTPYEDKLPYGLREVRRRSASGEAWLDSPPPRAEVERRVREVFEPYHAEVAARLAAARARHGVAILVSAHSYPDVLFPRAADVVLGTRGGASAAGWARDAVADVARAHGLSLALDDPFPGGHAIERHARRDEGVHALQVELARRLYCDAPSFTPRPEDVARLRGFARGVVAALAAAARDHGATTPHEDAAAAR
ncbi:N-formylglutamate amidohydrolase [Sorangium sp. So ce296]|uniref:N-formylglutamate amidohydrolase n=1 Tax=Sorangium sp. So ce296 TaxID=3133296 RepID=UPI003F5F4B27